MKIKGHDGHEYSVTGQGQGNYATVAGSAGLASFLGINAGNLLGGMFGNGCNCNNNGWGTPVSRYEAGMMQELANKDGKIALLESNIYTDQKIADVYERLITRINADKEAQNAINLEQAVYNGTNTAALNCMKSQIAQLAALSTLVIPQNKVCDTGCCNG